MVGEGSTCAESALGDRGEGGESVLLLDRGEGGGLHAEVALRNDGTGSSMGDGDFELFCDTARLGFLLCNV